MIDRLPTACRFTRMLRTVPNAGFPYLLDETVRLLQADLSTEGVEFGQTIALDTKYVLAWVRENNPKDYVQDRFDKAGQPSGEPRRLAGLQAPP